jgi:hypothetical protein
MMESDLIARLRLLRAEGRRLRKTLIEDLRAFQKQDDLSFFTSPSSDKKGISVATTCTALMALVDANKLKKLDPDKDPDRDFQSKVGTVAVPPLSSETANSAEKTENAAASHTIPPENRSNNAEVESVVGLTPESKKPDSPKALFERVVQETWESSGLRDLNSFTTCMVLRTFGSLVGERVVTVADAATMSHLRPAEKDENKSTSEAQKKGAIEVALGDNVNPSLKDIIEAVGNGVPKTFRVSTYPESASMAYWFVDGVTKANVEIPPTCWKEIRDWAVRYFDSQLRHVVSGNDPLMDPISLAMASCLISRLRKTFHADAMLSEYVEKLPSQVELTYAVKQVFEQQAPSGIWHKYFPLFHFPKSGAADYTFSFEFLEAILIEFSDRDDNILANDWALDRIEKAIRWCDNNRFTFRKKDELFSGWNAGGSADDLVKGMPEAWATASIHMFLSKLDSAASARLQELILKRFPRMEEPLPKKWNELIDVEISFPSGQISLKTVLEKEILVHARQTNERKLRREPLEARRSALLFGPPGTSKTSFARAIAGQLKWPLIIVTPSDFLSSGLEQIYVRATEIFDDLMDLSGVVVLFDEMDALAQTRVNPALDVTRQLLTTSMLPKLADLYERGQVVFLMATNHKKDLDNAITRSGRFDLLLCVGPPTWSEKVKDMEKALRGLPLGEIGALTNLLGEYADTAATREELDLFTVGDFRGFIGNLMRKEQNRGERVSEEETVVVALNRLTRDGFQKAVKEWANKYIALAKVEKKPSDEIDALTEYNADKEDSRIQ